MGRRKYDDDDGRVIVKMNVEGMPWYTPPRPELHSSADGPPQELSRKETFWMLLGAMKAGLVVAAIFSVTLLIAVGICLLLWT